jgi:hypothetical protein
MKIKIERTQPQPATAPKLTMDFETAYEQFNAYMYERYYDEIRNPLCDACDVEEWITDRMKEEVGDWVKEKLSYEDKMGIITEWGFKDALDIATNEYGVDIREVEDPADFIVQGLIHSVFTDKAYKLIEAVMMSG